MKAHFLNALMAVVFSFLIWCAIGSHLNTEDEITIDLEIKTPPNVVVRDGDAVSERSTLLLRERVKITVRGPKEQIDRLASYGLRAQVVLTEEDVSEFLTSGKIEIEPARSARDILNFPKAVTLIESETAPRRIVLGLSKKGSQSVWIEAGGFRGKPLAGHRVTKVTLKVNQVTARGPIAKLRENSTSERWKTEPVNIQDAGAGTHRAEVGVVTPDGVTIDERVLVSVVIEPSLVEDWVEFPIEVLRMPRDRRKEITPFAFKLRPPPGGWTRKLKLRGPESELRRLQREFEQSRLPGLFVDYSKLPMAYILLNDILAKEAGASEDLHIKVIGLPKNVELLPNQDKKIRVQLIKPD